MTTTLERLDTRRLSYRFDLGLDVPWARAGEPGLRAPDRLLARLGFDVTALSQAPEARASLDALFALVTASRFCALERDVIAFVAEEGARLPSVSAQLLVQEEHKHVALFERLSAALTAAHPAEARALEAVLEPPPSFAHLRAHAARYASSDEVAYAFWLHTLFFEEYTIFLQHALEEERAAPIQPLWLAAHHLHRQEELQHVLTDAAYLEASPLDDDARRKMAKALWLFLDERFDALFGLDACTRALAALHPGVSARPPQRLSALPLLDDVLAHDAFRRTRAAAPALLALRDRTPETRRSAEARLDGGPPACALADDDTLTARLRARQTSDARVTFIEADGAEHSSSHAALLDEARARLAALTARGARPGDPVLLLTIAPSTTVPWLWACLLGGLRAAPLALPSADKDSEEARRLLRIARLLGTKERAPFVVVDDFVLPLVEAALAVDAEAARAALVPASERAPAAGAREHTPRADDVAIVQFSSGSLGDPRGVLLTHRNLLANATAMLAARGGDTRETFVSWLPLFHDMGLIGYHLTPLVADAHQVLLPPLRFVKEPLAWLRALSQHRATVTGAPHFALARLLPLLTSDVVHSLDLTSLHTFLVGAEPLTLRTLTAFSTALAPAGLRPDAVCPAYGLAEATLAVTMSPRGARARALVIARSSLEDPAGVTHVSADAPDALALVDCGAPIPGVRVRVVDERGAPRPEGTTGTLVIAGPTVSAGYHGEPTPHAGERWLDTGDLGLIADGRLYVTGRKKDVFFIAGRNHYANDVEAVARELAFVHPGAVGLAVDWDPGFGVDALALFVALKEDALAREGLSVDAALAQVFAHVQRRMGLSLDRVVQIDKRDVPRTSSGKLKRRALLDRLRAGALSGAASFVRPGARTPDAPRAVSTSASTDAASQATADARSDAHGALVDDVRRVWAEVLELPLESIARSSSYRALGGDSFRAIQIHDRLERLLGVALSPELLVVGTTPDAMARFLAPVAPRGQRAPPPRAARAPVRDPAPAPPRAVDEPIALVSLALRVPGASSSDALWRLLLEGRAMFSAPPALRHTEGARARGAWLEHIDRFDPAPFSLSDDEATAMGPAQRLVLEVALEALAGAALPSRRVGVFIGAGDDGTSLRYVHDPSLVTRHSLLGALTNLIAARAARTFSLTGPALVVDSACSSSLAAVHLACQSLRAGECDAALAGGAQVGLTGALLESFERAGLLSRSGVARPFDDDADGLVPGEAVAVVVLKRASDAARDGDRVLAFVRGSALNNDGGALSGTAPSPDGQRDVVARAWRSAGLSPSRAALFEAHAAGTAFGDAVEARVLAELCAAPDDEVHKDDARDDAHSDKVHGGDARAVIGSIKGNLGHTLSAAGVLGLIKATLALAHRTAPPTPGLTQPSRRVDFPSTRLVPAFGAPRPLPALDAPLFAGVSAFGLGGTNVHVVLEGPPRATDAAPDADGAADPDAPVVLALAAAPGGLADSARAARDALLEQLRARPPLAQSPTEALAVVAAAVNGTAELLGGPSAALGAGPAGERRAFVVTDAPGAVAALGAIADARAEAPAARSAHARGRVAFVLPGPGSQLPGMGRALFAHEPVFRDALRACAAISARLDLDLLALMFADEEGAGARIHRLAHAQPAVFSYGYALSQLWKYRGVEPALVIGHSAGELLAAHLGGVLSLDDALALVIARGRAMAQAAPGRMAAVLASVERVERVLARHPGVSVAAENAPEQVVVSGTEQDVARAAQAFDAEGMSVRLLDVDCAAHSEALLAAHHAFTRALDAARFHPRAAAHLGTRPALVSTVAGRALDAAFDAAHFRAHLTARVDFVSAVRRARALGADTFLELSATAGLSSCVRQILDATPPVSERDSAAATDALVVACGARGEPERTTLAHAAAALYEAGLPLRPSTLRPRATSTSAAVSALPADVLPFAWRRRRLWVEARARAVDDSAQRSVADEPALREHVTAGTPSAPAALLLDRALDALGRTHGPVDLTDVVVERPLLAAADTPPSALVLAFHDAPTDDGAPALAVTTTRDRERVVHLSARYAPARGRTHTALDLDALRARLPHSVPGAAVYARLDVTGFVMGPAMRAVHAVLRGERELLATLRTPEHSSRGRLIDPALLDGASHAVAAFFLERPGAQMFLGFSLEALRVYAPVHDACLAYVRLRTALKDNTPAVRYDIVLTSEHGELLAEVEDFAARRVELRATGDDARLTGVTVPPLTVPPITVPPGGASVTPVPAAAADASRGALVALVRRLVAERLRRAPEQIAEHAPLARLGVDSLLAVELVRRLEALLQLKLHATLLFEAPTVSAVVDRVLALARDRGVVLKLPATPPAGPARSEDPR